MRASATTSSPTAREPLIRTTSPGWTSSGARSAAFVCVGDPLTAVRARELPDSEHDVDSEIAHELADLLVVLGRRRAELGHLAEHRDGAALVLREVLERCAHRRRVRVVRVVDQQAAARKRRLLAAPARELDLDSPLRQREAERPHREQRRGRVLRLVPRGERELELERLAAEVEADPAATLDPLERRHVLLAEAVNLDVVTAEVRLEQGLVRARPRCRLQGARRRPRPSPAPRSRSSRAARGAPARCS